MKRSEINAIMQDADSFMKSQGFYLPPFAYWRPDEWRQKGDEIQEIPDKGLGWDVTDFGSGDFARIGLFVFTIRNGALADLKRGAGKVYAEKILLVDVDQVTPMHFHTTKFEDIINRGGGQLAIQVYNSTPKNELADSDVEVSTDGVRRHFGAGDTLILKRGESITIPAGLYHKFWGVGSRVLAGEVSLVNDDHTDNHFHEQVGRFPAIDEDEPPLHLLCTDYDRYYDPKEAEGRKL